MPVRELRIESNYVVATETVVEVVSSTHTPDDTILTLIDLPEFERLFHARHPDSTTNPKALWHMLLGNHPDLAERVSCGIRLSYTGISWREHVVSEYTHYRLSGEYLLRALDETGELRKLDELEICLPDGKYLYDLSAADAEKISAALKRLTTLYGDFYGWYFRERLLGDVLKRLRDLEEIALNPAARYLSLEACEKLLTYYSHFTGGIDFEHLPAGFFLTKNPLSGVCDVLHYSDYVAAHQKDVSPFAITLPPIAEEAVDVEPWALEPPQAEWYAFLQSKRGNGLSAFCSERELKNAFIAFRKCIERLGLEFYSPDFSSLTHNTNPLILLGRWETVLTNPYLKKENLTTQWRVLTQLPLQRGFEAIRAITDYQHSETPCRFLIPEMSFSHDVSLQTGRLVGHHRIEAYQPIKESEQIMYCDELGERYCRLSSSFPQALLWRYLAYQPQCHSIAFYRQALAQIDGAGEPSVRGLCRMLVTATTGGNHQAGREADDLADWSSLCSLIKSMFSLPTSVVSAFLLAWGGSEAERGRTVDDYLAPLNATVPFLYSAAQYVNTYANDITDHLTPLLRGKTSQLEKIRGTCPTQGARFYFVDKEWKVLGIKRYLDLLDDICKLIFDSSNGEYSWIYRDKLLLPHLSTFNLRHKDQVMPILRGLNALVVIPYPTNRFGEIAPPPELRKRISFCMTLFNDVTKQSNIDALHELVSYFNTMDGTDLPSFYDILIELEKKFSQFFEKDYFTAKKQALLEADPGLTTKQRQAVRDCRFSNEQSKSIIHLQSALVRNNPHIDCTAILNDSNASLIALKNLVTPHEFTQFCQQLMQISEVITAEPASFIDMLHVLQQQRTLDAFTQCYICNQKDKCVDPALAQKFIVFMKNLRPLTLAKVWAVERIVLQEMLATIVLNSPKDAIVQADYVSDMNKLLTEINKIIIAQPHLHYYLFNAFNHIPKTGKDGYLSYLVAFVETLIELNHQLPAGDKEYERENMLIFDALLAAFHSKPHELTILSQQISLLKEDMQRFMLRLVSHLLSNQQPIVGLDNLVKHLQRYPEHYETLKMHCKTPPYPTLDTLVSWLKAGTFALSYSNHSLRPFGARRIHYAFHQDKYFAQRQLFIGPSEEFFSDALAAKLHTRLCHHRTASIEDLKTVMTVLRSKVSLSDEEKLELLCICIEMLARTTPQFEGSVQSLISQEVNTTQVMALYSILLGKHSKHISEIDTGEGKSRIMMILASCQAAQGKTVDFLSSDMALARRDYLVYNSFFTALGIKTSLVSMSTPKQLYQRGGVNFSDNAQLLLLRNRCDIAEDPFAFLDQQETKRCLLIDEVDKFIHDRAKDAFNYAARSQRLSGFVWVYPHLVNFVNRWEKDNGDTLFIAEELIDSFLKYVTDYDTDVAHQASLATLHQAQLTTWLYAAHTTIHLQEDKHYRTTEADATKLFPIRDSEGRMRYSRKILVLDNGRPLEGSSFADGVQQCLCVIENYKAKQEAFVIPPENETQCASYPVSFMKSYERGSIYGVSGTTRSENSAINHENFHYERVPREKPLIREDKNHWVAKDERQQIAFIKRSIKEQFAKGHPVLLICKDDNQSKALYHALTTDPTLRRLIKHSQRIHALSSPDEEKEAIHRAGSPGSLTVSTAGMFGRGVDIHAAHLFVAAAYVPTFADDKQIKGRTGRIGKPGEYRMIINLNDPDCPLDGTTFNIDHVIDKAQKNRESSALFQEEVTKLYANFLRDMHLTFFHTLKGIEEPGEKLKLLEKWQLFLSQIQKDWDSKKKELLIAVETENKEIFLRLFSSFTTHWEARISRDELGTPTIFKSTQAEVTYQGLLGQKGLFKAERKPIKVQSRYDVADDGQARIYTTLFARTTATLRGERSFFAECIAWHEGRGTLFPDLKAVLCGERMLFANLRATIARWITELSNFWEGIHLPQVSSTPAYPGS